MLSFQSDSITTPGGTEGASIVPILGGFCVLTYGPSGNRQTVDPQPYKARRQRSVLPVFDGERLISSASFGVNSPCLSHLFLARLNQV